MLLFWFGIIHGTVAGDKVAINAWVLPVGQRTQYVSNTKARLLGSAWMRLRDSTDNGVL